MKEFLKRWLIGTLAVLIATKLVSGIRYETWTDLIVATLVLGILNSILRPLLLLLSLPLVIVTLGLFTLVINALLLLLVDALIPGFEVDGFWSAFWAGLIISLVTLILNSLTGSGNARLEVRGGKGKRPPKGGNADPGGDGPVIDV